MSDYPVQVLEAVPKIDISKYSKLINKDEFDYYIYIKVPSEYIHNYVLTDVNKLGEHPGKVCLIKYVDYLGGPWYRIHSDVLDKKVGYSRYQLKFVEKHDNTISSLYFSYILQDDHPDKPYLYMDPEERTCCCEASPYNQRRFETL